MENLLELIHNPKYAPHLRELPQFARLFANQQSSATESASNQESHEEQNEDDNDNDDDNNNNTDTTDSNTSRFRDKVFSGLDLDIKVSC